MDSLKIIQKGIDYIEENLKSELTAKELSKMAGFSVFYYYKLFHAAVGIPLMQYIIRRKLLNAIYDIGQGNKMIDVAIKIATDLYFTRLSSLDMCMDRNGVWRVIEINLAGHQTIQLSQYAGEPFFGSFWTTIAFPLR